jgi:hypothetical protein
MAAIIINFFILFLFELIPKSLINSHIVAVKIIKLTGFCIINTKNIIANLENLDVPQGETHLRSQKRNLAAKALAEE